LGKGSGYGKTILFGEHFVVYGLPAIAAAISATTTAIVRRTREPGWTLEDNRPAVAGYKKKRNWMNKRRQLKTSSALLTSISAKQEFTSF
jgi:mevalonate kinase